MGSFGTLMWWCPEEYSVAGPFQKKVSLAPYAAKSKVVDIEIADKDSVFNFNEKILQKSQLNQEPEDQYKQILQLVKSACNKFY